MRAHACAGLPIVVKDLTAVKGVRFTEVCWFAKTRFSCHNLHSMGEGEAEQAENYAWRVFHVNRLDSC